MTQRKDPPSVMFLRVPRQRKQFMSQWADSYGLSLNQLANKIFSEWEERRRHLPLSNGLEGESDGRRKVSD
jgi:hypothetical protein